MFTHALLSLNYIIILLLLHSEFPPLLWGLMLLLGIWNVLLGVKVQLARPHTLTVNLLALVCLVVLFATVSVKQSVLLFVAMLLQAAILKLLVAKTQKQLDTIIVLSFFSISTVFLFSYSLFSTVILSVMYVSLFAVLAQSRSTKSVKTAYKSAISTLAFALPLGALMLLFIPKLPAFWQLPGASSAKTGLSDKVNPFNIAKLTESSELVFRAELNEAASAPYYWRAMVHDEFDGTSWLAADKHHALRRSINFNAFKNTAQIYIEPASNTWLYTLADGVSQTSGVKNLTDGLLERTNVSASSFQYQIQYRTFLNETLNSSTKAHLTQLPQGANPLAVSLAKQLASKTQTHSEFANALLNYFAQQGFSYTLTPDVINSANPLDTFLTQTKRGFCGHYASSSTFMFRAVGIPARVVSGYLGGERIAGSNHIAVYQYDAHAWVEYYDGQRWQRFDPTSVVAPERLNGSLSQLSQMQEEFKAKMGLGLLRLDHIKAFNWLRIRLEQLDYSWTKWVLGFDGQSQKNLLSKLLGSQIAHYSMALLVFILALVLLGYLLWQNKKSPTTLTPVAQALQQLFAIADKKGVKADESATPVQKLTHVSQHFEHVQSDIKYIEHLYVRHTYQGQELSTQEQNQFKKRIKKIIKAIG